MVTVFGELKMSDRLESFFANFEKNTCYILSCLINTVIKIWGIRLNWLLVQMIRRRSLDRTKMCVYVCVRLVNSRKGLDNSTALDSVKQKGVLKWYTISRNGLCSK